MPQDFESMARTREPFFFNALVRFTSDPTILNECSYDLSESHLLSRTYFLLNRMYKDSRIKNGHYTKLPKRAALKMASVMAIRPFTHPENQKNRALFFLNPLFALTIGYSVIGHEFAVLGKAHAERLSFFLDSLRFPSLENFFLEEGKPNIDHYDQNLTNDERTQIETLIAICELACYITDQKVEVNPR